MSIPRTFEKECLAPLEKLLSGLTSCENDVDHFEFRLQILEAVAACLGCFDLAAFQEIFGIQSLKNPAELIKLSLPVVSAIKRFPIHPALILSILARESLCEQDRKSTGAFHTDFRLATRLAQLAAPGLSHESRVIDPACGAGILLVALTYAVCGANREKVARWLAHGVCAADSSPNSLRGTLLCLASFTNDLAALKTMRERWYCGDSLLADESVWEAMGKDGFDAVIGNPPWEKIKISKHEFVKSLGTRRHYGSPIQGLHEDLFADCRWEKMDYSKKLMARYPSLADSEPDLYIAFTEFFFKLVKEEGVVVALLPAGLIRSQGTHQIRSKILKQSKNVCVSIIDNRARFFPIDSRFKFLLISSLKTSNEEKDISESIRILHEKGTHKGIEITGNTTINPTSLKAARPDLSIPEVRNQDEWRLFSKISQTGISWEEVGYGWTPKFCREVDMTKARASFLAFPVSGALPIVEGRMVQAHRFGVKGYVSGTGRSSSWEIYSIGASRLSPQYWIGISDVPPSSRYRVDKIRIGFCDIAGQTNERSLMASLIPAGVVCGNKVPTILFPEDPCEDRLFVWTAIANSFVFDWMLRRIITTTVNYFLLQSVPLPNIKKNSLTWRKLASASHELWMLNSIGATQETCRRMAALRAEIDAEVGIAYGLDLNEMQIVLQDFPLLDRGQRVLPGEKKSTITRDSVMAAMTKKTANSSSAWLHRMLSASELGAVAYVPSELALSQKNRGGMF